MKCKTLGCNNITDHESGFCWECGLAFEAELINAEAFREYASYPEYFSPHEPKEF